MAYLLLQSQQDGSDHGRHIIWAAERKQSSKYNL